MHDEAKCGCRKRLAVRLAEAFEPTNWHHDEKLSKDAVADWLGVTPEEAATLLNVGLLRSWDDQVTIEDLLAFIEETNWLKLRAEKQAMHLRSRVDWYRERRERRKRELEEELAAQVKAEPAGAPQ